MASTLPTDELWITYGSRKNVQNTPTHAIAMSLSPDKASTPPMFHALTGCGNISFLGGHEKKNGLECVKSVSSTDTSAKVFKISQKENTEECMAVLERFVVPLYDCTSSLTKVNEAQ